jgi:integrase
VRRDAVSHGCRGGAGIPAKIISERLGHATIQITLDTYSHVLPGLDAQAAETVARLILGDGPASTDVSKA